MLLNYAHTYTNNANMRYYASNMILHVESDASYLFMALSLSHIAGHYYLIKHDTNPTNPSYANTNGAIIPECKNS